MSNESAPECLKHRDNRNVQVRLDYMLLYRNETKAKIIRILETWTDTKYAEWYKGLADSKEQEQEPPEENLWITMSYDQFALFAYGTIQHDTVKQCVDELLAIHHIQRRPHPEFPYGPPQYLLNRELVQQALDDVEIPFNLFDLTGKFVSPRKKHTPQEKSPQGGGINPRGHPGKIPPGWGETSHPSNNTTKNTKNYSKNESTSVASATSARTLSDTENDSHQGDDDALADHALAAPPVQHADSSTGIPADLLGAGTLRRNTLPETTPLPTQAPSTEKVEGALVQQTPFSVTSPSDGVVGSAPPSSGPRASGRRGKPQQQDVTQAELPPAPKFHLTEAEEQFWGLWCQVWFNKDIPPGLNDTAYKHVVKLAPHITTAEQLDSLIKRAKKDLEDSQGLKRKTVFLGNLVTSYSGWKQEQKPPEQPKPKQEAPAQPLPVLRVLPPDRSKSPRLRAATQVGRA